VGVASNRSKCGLKLEWVWFNESMGVVLENSKILE
jgi:hypothetical protein